MKQFVIKFQNVSVVYANGFCAVRDVSFEIAEGECLAIVGESGSGKTTIARAALGLLPKTAKVSGSIKIGDTEIVGASEQTLQNARGLAAGFVAQEPYSAFNPLSRIDRHISEAWRAHGQKPPSDFIIKSLSDFGIANAARSAQNYPHEWSGGMLQRATIIAAGAHQPALIIADEPTSALDASRAGEILKALRSGGSSVMLVSHDIALTAQHASRIAVCFRGEIVEIGAAAEVIKNPGHFYTKNLLEATVYNESFQPAINSNQSEVVLEAKNLSRFYQNKNYLIRAVAQADLQIKRGEINGIYGDSGSGKSTLLRLLTTIEMPSSGQVFFGGELVADGETQRFLNKKKRPGFVLPILQDPVSSLDARWAIWRSITEPLTAKHLAGKYTKSQRREIAQRILAEVGLKDSKLEARPKELSIGQCQRVCIARALIAKPALIIADEPTSALDASNTKMILHLFVKIAARGTAILIVSHDEPVLRAVCHRVWQMRDGILLKQN